MRLINNNNIPPVELMCLVVNALNTGTDNIVFVVSMVQSGGVNADRLVRQ